MRVLVCSKQCSLTEHAPWPLQRQARAASCLLQVYAKSAQTSLWHGEQEGVAALYRGWLPSVIGVVPYVGLNFAVYETLKDMAIRSYGCSSERELSRTYRLCAGGIAGTIGQTLAYPFDVVRRRLQARWLTLPVAPPSCMYLAPLCARFCKQWPSEWQSRMLFMFGTVLCLSCAPERTDQQAIMLLATCHVCTFCTGVRLGWRQAAACARGPGGAVQRHGGLLRAHGARRGRKRAVQWHHAKLREGNPKHRHSVRRLRAGV